MHRIPSRVRFDEDLRIMEIDLVDLTLQTTHDVGVLYDMLEHRLAETGQKWFFLVNYRNCQIYPAAWVEFATRGKRLNLTFSLGTVRCNTQDEINAEIEQRSGEEGFDANLVDTRDKALSEIAVLREAFNKRQVSVAAISETVLDDFQRRVQFDPARQIMDVDFSGLTFTDSRLVNAFYDMIEARLADAGATKWYFLVNYRNCTVDPEAWVAFAHRGKRLNIARSLGSARYATTDDTQEAIQLRAGAQNFDANIFPSREAALTFLMHAAADTKG